MFYSFIENNFFATKLLELSQYDNQPDVRVDGTGQLKHGQQLRQLDHLEEHRRRGAILQDGCTQRGRGYQGRNR